MKWGLSGNHLYLLSLFTVNLDYQEFSVESVLVRSEWHLNLILASQTMNSCWIEGKVNRIVNILVRTPKIWWENFKGMKYVCDFPNWIKFDSPLSQREDSRAAQSWEPELLPFRCCLAPKVQDVNQLDQCLGGHSERQPRPQPPRHCILSATRCNSWESCMAQC